MEMDHSGDDLENNALNRQSSSSSRTNPIDIKTPMTSVMTVSCIRSGRFSILNSFGRKRWWLAPF